VAVAGALGLAVARWLAVDRWSPRLFALEALLPWLVLPVSAVPVVALVLRRRALLVVASAVVALHASWTVPDLTGGGAVAPSDGDLVVVAVNAQRGNAVPDELAAVLAARHADVVVVTELTPATAAAVDRALPPSAYPGREVLADEGFFGAGIWSTRPLAAQDLVSVDGRPTPRVRLAGSNVSIVAVHTIQPLADLDGLHRGFVDLAELASLRTVLAGDFNASRRHAGFRQLLADGPLRDAHDQAGRGLARTWPAAGAVPPFALLDHVLVGWELGVVAVHELDAPGSDHRAVEARLRV
jgi:endonuclease/exonuclease/phosphatase (EEP) superfamily protein YafD